MKTKCFLINVAFIVLYCFHASAETQVSGFSTEEALQFGERMYRDGILPNGVPMKAMVMGDIPMDGRMFTCDDCHQRSGLGSDEGTIITWPTNGKELYAPRQRTGAYKEPSKENSLPAGRRLLPKYYQREPARPAYTDETLARVLRSGIDPGGRKLDPIMPKYRFTKENMAIMVHYLKNLSVEISPGVDATTIQFATVIGAGVSEEKKAAMLSPLQAHVDAHNSQSRHEEKRAQSGPFYKSERHQAYRRINLNIWTLTGAETEWGEQLEAYYAETPVFAFLGGISDGNWDPIHQFCETKKIPTIFPITDLPKISEVDWYTLYFSKGFHQEGESAAKYIRKSFGKDEEQKVIQLFDSKNPRSLALKTGYDQTWKTFNREPVDSFDIAADNNDVAAYLETQLNASVPVILLTWVDRDVFISLQRVPGLAQKSALILGSTQLLKQNYSGIEQDVNEKLLLTYPASIEKDKKTSRLAVRGWLKARKIEESYFDIQAKMYFLGWMLPGAIKSMRNEFFREYFMEGFDMMIDQDYSIAVYPRLTFGPGQRYTSKGCYLVKLSDGPEPELVPASDWVIY